MPTRIGGFGGVAGLAEFLGAEGFTHLVDATHPFAAQISDNAATAARLTGLPFAVLTRPPWQQRPGDRWTEVPDAAAAAMVLGELPRRVLLTIGRQEVGAFAAAPHHDYLVRSIDPPEALAALPRARLLLARGPFTVAGETRLLREAAIEVVVSKNSGGPATYAKIDAARDLGLDVIMVTPPPRPEATTLHDPAAILDWIRGT
ncbi:cobalt-precorrin-6A reductase [Methylobrevis pamukkalensis]|uniref:Precorrin-6A reductase n=1 Tax=Methylobrevis pamukkalensis TaxID=1439726 RepID=A0A1E3H8C6_9HYPH|nr:Precorrin-6A reductase [Methylobrevis pamukkalensis]